MPEPTILTYAGWEEDARSIMGYSESDISDIQLHSITLLGQAEHYVKSVVDDWQDLTGNNKTLLQLATLYMIAHYLRENSSFMMPTTIKDGENYISWGNRQRIEQAEKNLYYDKAWECVEMIQGIKNSVGIMGLSVPRLNLITGE